MNLHIDIRDWWIGYYRGEHHHYVCVLPCVVLSWNRTPPELAGRAA
jgi:hypothetical protein